jgi:hypothetical protein
VVAPGETVNVRTRLLFECPDQERPYHLVVVVDRSAIGRDGPATWAFAALQQLFDRLSLHANPRARVGIVAFAGHGEVLCLPTNDPDGLAACLGRLDGSADGSAVSPSGLAEGIREGVKVLLMARAAEPVGTNGPPVAQDLLVLTRPPGGADPSPACPAARSQANAAREREIGVGIASLGGAGAPGCLLELARPELFYPAAEFDQAIAHHERRAWSTELRVWSVDLHELLDPHMELRVDSLDPMGGSYDPDRHVIHWTDVHAVHGDPVLAYAVVPTEPGRWPVRRIGYGLFEDTDGRRGTIQLAEQHVTVSGDDGPARPFRISLPLLYRRGGGEAHPFAGF